MVSYDIEFYRFIICTVRRNSTLNLHCFCRQANYRILSQAVSSDARMSFAKDSKIFRRGSIVVCNICHAGFHLNHHPIDVFKVGIATGH